MWVIITNDYSDYQSQDKESCDSLVCLKFSNFLVFGLFSSGPTWEPLIQKQWETEWPPVNQRTALILFINKFDRYSSHFEKQNPPYCILFLLNAWLPPDFQPWLSRIILHTLHIPSVAKLSGAESTAGRMEDTDWWWKIEKVRHMRVGVVAHLWG